MKAVGIVAEYNPFHLGHLYQINKVKELLGEDTVIISIMSGDYVQRGEAAIFSKYARAEAACRSGVNIVAELPLPFSLASAETFAASSLFILDAIGVDYLAFGSESSELTLLSSLAEELLKKETNNAITSFLKSNANCSYAYAREQVLSNSNPYFSKLLSSPNDILACEYIKAIKKNCYNIEPIAIKRIGAPHDSLSESSFYPSASMIREYLKTGNNISESFSEEAYCVFSREIEEGRGPVFGNKIELQLITLLRCLEIKNFLNLPGCDSGLGSRLYKAVRSQTSMSEIIREAKTKRYAESNIRRLLFCAALGITKEHFEDNPEFIRILSADDVGINFLKMNKEAIKLPVISKPVHIKKLNTTAERQFALIGKAHDIYVTAYSEVMACGEDWKRSPNILLHTK